MPKVKFTKSKISNIRPPVSGVALYSDTVAPGLVYRITHSGTGSFVFRYRNPRTKQQRSVTIGRAAITDVEDARTKVQEYQRMLSEGIDPQESRINKKHHKSISLSQAINEYEDSMKKSGIRDRKNRISYLIRYLEPNLGAWSLDDITVDEISEALEKADERSSAVARHLRMAASAMFTWAANKRYVRTNPVQFAYRPAKAAIRSRYLTPAEIAFYWQAANELGYPFGPYYQLLLLTGQRRQEVCGMTWDELELDEGLWTLPGERTKNGREHRVFLPQQATSILKDIEYTGKISPEFVFSTNGQTPISGHTRANGRIRKAVEAAAARAHYTKSIKPWTPHDIRRTFATQIGEHLNCPIHVTEAILNHVSGTKGGIVGVYQHQQYREERKRFPASWAVKVQEFHRTHYLDKVEAG